MGKGERGRDKGKENGKGERERDSERRRERRKEKREEKKRSATDWVNYMRRLGNFGLKNPCIDGATHKSKGDGCHALLGCQFSFFLFSFLLSLSFSHFSVLLSLLLSPFLYKWNAVVLQVESAWLRPEVVAPSI
jgi:hypothetical protein